MKPSAIDDACSSGMVVRCAKKSRPSSFARVPAPSHSLRKQGREHFNFTLYLVHACLPRGFNHRETVVEVIGNAQPHSNLFLAKVSSSYRLRVKRASKEIAPDVFFQDHRATIVPREPRVSCPCKESACYKTYFEEPSRDQRNSSHVPPKEGELESCEFSWNP